MHAALANEFSDNMYWQVADQPAKEGPNSLVMVDLEGKEVKKGCHPRTATPKQNQALGLTEG